ncbi:uncharacterized protein KY384_005264 [Bacidia gigantensis]|uniref:uncharacterized protein n=1 Tax=Bacidia gigantensis TaxID=2732470 RepID=UPI001D0573F8|nr:uncharacterized protein KY384_005264 [Bacidia gigantensis]KAG8529783.1 hypothetical protein KY384_005264 [Bacidia gigantensis]
MATPNFFPASSRGAIPHISQDMMRDHMSVHSMYTAAEDSDSSALWSLQDIEKAPVEMPPVYDFPATRDESPLRKFIALQKETLLVLGPRRISPLPCPASSTSTSIGIVTSLGFSMLECGVYVQAIQKLRPDIVLGMGDVLYGHQPGVRRAERMGDRTQSWLNALVAGMNDVEEGTPNTALFAPILPLEAEKQRWYLGALEDDLHDHISGLVLHEIESADDVPDSLSLLPRLYLGEAKDPHELLHAIEAGLDIFTIPFINEASDAGLALDFSFVRLSDASQDDPRPLALDLWSISYATDISPLSKDCNCYTCTYHHRAFIYHLLSTREMLSWVLLQLHNYHIMGEFFAQVRQSIMRHTFGEDKLAFGNAFEQKLPTKTGQGPRIRGYQTKSEGKGEPRQNPKAYRSLNEQSRKLSEAAPLSQTAGAVDLEQLGFAQMFEDPETSADVGKG